MKLKQYIKEWGEKIIQDPSVSDFLKVTDDITWGDALAQAVKELGGVKEVLYLEYSDDMQGMMDVDLVLRNGKVFSYKYYFGTCSACDMWQDKFGDMEYDDQVKAVTKAMKGEATIFNNLSDYSKWILMLKGGRQGARKVSWE